MRLTALGTLLEPALLDEGIPRGKQSWGLKKKEKKTFL